MDVGLVMAFLGGTLALLSPCSVLVVPAFLASAVGARSRVTHCLVFYAGLLTVLVPLGVGAGALGAVMPMSRAGLVTVAAILLIGFGVLQLLGAGFDAAGLIPGMRGLQGRIGALSGTTRTAALGMASGVAGFCVGPVLGAVLTLAASQGNVVISAVLVSVYGAGMAVPLAVVAAFASRSTHRLQGLSRIRRATITILGRPVSLVRVVSALVLIAAGVLFWVTNGLARFPEIVPGSIQSWLHHGAGLLAHPLLDVAAVLTLSTVAILLMHRYSSRR